MRKDAQSRDRWWRPHGTRFLLALMRWTGLVRLFQFLHRNEIAILMFHGVMEERDHLLWSPLRRRLPQTKLETYLRVLSKCYRFVSLMDAVEMLQGRRPVQPYSMVLTFDDGYRNHLTHVLPVLRRYQVPAAFFVSTGFADHCRPFWYDRLDYAVQHAPGNGRAMKVGSLCMCLDHSTREALHESFLQFVRAARKERMPHSEFQQEMDRLIGQLEEELGRGLSDLQKEDDWSALLSWEQIGRLDSEGMTVGSHTVDHVDLSRIDLEEVRDQLTRSKQDIESHTGKPCLSVCYPYGSYNESVAAVARECGYLCGLTTETGLNRRGDNLMTLKRVNWPMELSPTEFLTRMACPTGLRGWWHRRGRTSLVAQIPAFRRWNRG